MQTQTQTQRERERERERERDRHRDREREREREMHLREGALCLAPLLQAFQHLGSSLFGLRGGILEILHQALYYQFDWYGQAHLGEVFGYMVEGLRFKA